MRILIGNHIDDTLLSQRDQRAFSQRIFWFAKDHDLVILSSDPDAEFLGYVSSLTGLDIGSLAICITPPGKFEGRLFDPDTLGDERFVLEVAERLRGRPPVTEIFALWPSAQVAELGVALGLPDAMPGARFFQQQGDELANNKGNFRAFAAAAGVPIAEGAVCRSPTHAEQVMTRLLEMGPVMVKQAHNGAGRGNQLVAAAGRAPQEHPGAAQVCELPAGAGAVAAYWKQHWGWASAGGRLPVVVERFVPGASTIYAEFHADDAGVRHTEAGSLGFAGGRLVAETVPLRNVSDGVRERLLSLGARLARTYWSFGYRGHMSADALVDAAGNVTFTELNARIGASLHLYQALAQDIVQVNRNPARTVTQYVSPQTWKLRSVGQFLDAAAQAEVDYDRSTRTGVIACMALAGEPGAGGLLFCIAHADDAGRQEMLQRLDARLAG
jgi:hypothetical protein